MIGGDSQRQTTLIRPRCQLASQQLLGLLALLSVAEVEQTEPLRLKLFGIIAQFIVDLGVQVIIGRLVGHGFVQFTCNKGLGERLFAVRPHEQSHLLPLREHGPN